VCLPVGLNASTSPQVLKAIHGHPNVAIRYLTRRFHAKIYIFDNGALIGSSNLSDGGLIANREATIWLDQAGDSDKINETQVPFAELWEAAQVLTPELLKKSAIIHASIVRSGPYSDTLVDNVVGKAEPVNINVASAAKTPERLLLEELRPVVYEQYRPAFNEVMQLLQEQQFHRPEPADAGLANERRNQPSDHVSSESAS
jgi:phosphatidylserine/phosphatidylglycerophosphate/cardiolipin synthase-like enzyme